MSYSTLAKYYDALMTDFDYDGYEAFIAERVRKGKGLDLACGSGEMTVRLKKRGFDVDGADFSPEMLNSAVEKAKKHRLHICFYIADLNNLKIEKGYDFVTVVCDGFNYVSNGNKLKKAFEAIYGALADGGVFIFDISTSHKLKNVLGSNLFYEDNENLTYFWQNTDRGNSVDMELTFFEKQKDGLYLRSDELQTQYAYSDDFVCGALTETGFRFTAFNERFENYKQGDNRLIIYAEK